MTATPSVQSRKTVREAIASGLQTHLGSKVQAVYSYQVSRFDKRSPVIVVNSTGSERQTAVQNLLTTESALFFDIHIFVRYQDEDASPTPYTEQDSENTLDGLELEVTNYMLLHGYKRDQTSPEPAWLELVSAGRSQVTRAIFEGIDYRHERIPVGAVVGNIA